MYSVEFRVIPSTAEVIVPRQSELVRRAARVADSADAPDKQQAPVPVVKDVLGEEERRELLQDILNKITGANRYIRFDRHDKTGEIVVRVIDKETNEVVKEIPPEKILNVVFGLCELAGLLVDETA